MSTAKEPKHALPKKNLTNVPRPDRGNTPHSTIAATTRAGTSSLHVSFPSSRYTVTSSSVQDLSKLVLRRTCRSREVI